MRYSILNTWYTLMHGVKCVVYGVNYRGHSIWYIVHGIKDPTRHGCWYWGPYSCWLKGVRVPLEGVEVPVKLIQGSFRIDMPIKGFGA